MNPKTVSILLIAVFANFAQGQQEAFISSVSGEVFIVGDNTFELTVLSVSTMQGTLSGPATPTAPFTLPISNTPTGVSFGALPSQPAVFQPFEEFATGIVFDGPVPGPGELFNGIRVGVAGPVINYDLQVCIDRPCTIPEPASASLMVIAAAGLGLLRRHRH